MTKPKSDSAISIVQYLRSCSPSILHEFELTRLNSVANLDKQMHEILRQMVKDTAEALVARMLIEHQRDFVPPATITIERGKQTLITGGKSK